MLLRSGGRGFAPSEREEEEEEEEERCPTFDNDTRNEGDSGGAIPGAYGFNKQ